MTEAEWLEATDPPPMLEYVRGRVGDRKLRLFAAACFGRLVGLLPDPRQRQGIEVLEQLAEGIIPRSACRGITAAVRQAIPRDDRSAGTPPADDPHFVGLMLYREFCSSSIAVHACHATAGVADGAGEQHEQTRLMRCIFGNPFRPAAFDPSWRTDAAVLLAHTVYESGNFSAMPILADALQDAGCDNTAILDHCRDANQIHVRGCWVVDLVLGRSDERTIPTDVPR